MSFSILWSSKFKGYISFKLRCSFFQLGFQIERKSIMLIQLVSIEMYMYVCIHHTCKCISEGYLHPNSNYLCSSGSYRYISQCHFFVSLWVFFSAFKRLACSLAVCWWKRTARIYGFASTSLWGWWTGSARLELNSIYVGSRCLTNGHIRHGINAGQLLVSVFYKNIWMNELRAQNIACFYIQWTEITRKSTMMEH